MRLLVVGLLAAFGVAACSDQAPLSPAGDDGTGPSAKLTVSGAKAGGHPGKRSLLALEAAHRDAFNAHDPAQYVPYWADDIVFEYVAAGVVANGKAETAAFMESVWRAFPDYRDADPPRRLVAGNIIVTECLPTQTQMGEWGGVPATGQPAVLPHLSIYEYEGSRIGRLTFYDDALSWLMQIGVMPVPALPPLVPSFTLPEPVPTYLAPLAAQTEAMVRFNSHDWAHWAQMIRPDADVYYNVLGAPINRDVLIALNELYLTGFPDLHGDIVRVLDMGDGWVTCQAVFTGTHNGPYLGVPATGRPMVSRLAWVAHYDAAGLLTYFHVYFNNMSVLQQIGAVPAA